MAFSSAFAAGLRLWDDLVSAMGVLLGLQAEDAANRVSDLINAQLFGKGRVMLSRLFTNSTMNVTLPAVVLVWVSLAYMIVSAASGTPISAPVAGATL